MRNSALIVGELCLDVCAEITAESSALAALPHGADVVADGTITLRPGGTALLFANALASATGLVPLIAAAVGTDSAGDLLADSIAEQGFPVAGLLRADGARTDILSISAFPGRGRLLARPAEKMMRKVQAWEWDRVADLVDAHTVGFAWISGYLFEGYEAAAMETMRTLFGQLRDRLIPIVVDLVPHDFASRIGSLHQLELDVGPIDVLVGEFLTLLDLGIGQLPGPGADVRAAMLTCARSAAQGRAGALIQHQITTSHYALAIAGPQLGEQIIDREIPAGGPRGLGDTLSVQGLQLLGLALPGFHSVPVAASFASMAAAWLSLSPVSRASACVQSARASVMLPVPYSTSPQACSDCATPQRSDISVRKATAALYCSVASAGLPDASYVSPRACKVRPCPHVSSAWIRAARPRLR